MGKDVGTALSAFLGPKRAYLMSKGLFMSYLANYIFCYIIFFARCENRSRKDSRHVYFRPPNAHICSQRLSQCKIISLSNVLTIYDERRHLESRYVLQNLKSTYMLFQRLSSIYLVFPSCLFPKSFPIIIIFKKLFDRPIVFAYYNGNEIWKADKCVQEPEIPID